MRAAMKQNPNMIRTLLGLSFSLIFLLGYAVYGATNDSGYYLYFSDHEETNPELISVGQHPVVKDGKTVWVWEFDVNPSNLTWINVSVTDVYEGSMLKVTNVAGNFWSHPELGNALESGVNCADKIKEGGEYIWVSVDCQVGDTHMMKLDNGAGNFVGLSHPDPALRDGGTVRAEDYNSALIVADTIFNKTHISNSWQISIEVEGNHSEISPNISVSYINEKIVNLKLFEIDAGTEMMWSLAALIGCFMVLLVPAFLIYYFSQQSNKKERKEVEIALEQDKIT
jgi:hypothetical protein